MDKKFLCLTLIGLCAAFLPAYSGDLYLLKIDSPESAEIVNQTVEYAHGRIDDRFIVELDEKQLNTLMKKSVDLELISKNIDIDNYFLLSRVRPTISKTAIFIEPKFAKDGNFILETSMENTNIFRREGFMVMLLKDLQTPFFYTPPMYSPSFLSSYPSDTLADLVVQDSLYSYDTRLEAFQTRLIYTDSILSARDWLVAKFQSFGYTEVTTDLFYYYGYPCYNVKCLKPGTTEADKLVVVGGHYDSINFDNEGSGMTYAPGADDNASGTTTVLEVARILSAIETKKSYLFCAFSAEEVGLVGAYDMAYDLYYNSTYDVECMLNYDMVAYTADEYDNVTIFSGANRVYADAMISAAQRVTDLIPYYAGAAGNSDHAAFDNYGFLVAYGQEGDFNHLGWHTNLDISSRLDFPYFEKIARMATALVGHIDNAAHVTPIEHVWDVGDGQSLMVEWGSCDPIYTYKVMYGTGPGNYTDTIDIPSVPPCNYTVSGLTEGQVYYFTVEGINPEGYGPISLDEDSSRTFVNPRAPSNLRAEPEYQRISLSWNANYELDLNHYRLLRRPEGGDWEILQDNLNDTTYEDLTVDGHIMYEYAVQAIDNDLNESENSGIAGGMAATFDWPLLFVDETSSGGGGINPSESDQAEFYDSLLLADVDYIKYPIDDGSQRLTRSMAGQFGSIIWLDDDISVQLFQFSMDSVSWFLEFNTNFCLGGWQTVYWMAGGDPLYEGDFAYDNLGISQVTDNTGFDFIGAFGQNGWPDLQTDTDNIFSGFLPNVAKFAVRPGAQVIYTFNSSSNNPDFEGEPCGVLYDTGTGKMIALSFPVYHLTDTCAVALMNKIFETFGIGIVQLYGDANNDDTINLKDITFLIRYLYKGGEAPQYPNQADANGDCEISILDITYLISFLYKGGPEPIPGCVE